MRLDVRRCVELPDTTIGLLSIDGRPFCWTLEDQAQPGGVKVPGETRIPAGVYPIRLYTAGRLYGRYSARYPWHRGMLQICDVPAFSCILIHPGNTDDDTRGCLLPGMSASLQPARVTSSVTAYERLYRASVASAAQGTLDIAVCDPPHIVPGVQRERVQSV